MQQNGKPTAVLNDCLHLIAIKRHHENYIYSTQSSMESAFFAFALATTTTNGRKKKGRLNSNCDYLSIIVERETSSSFTIIFVRYFIAQ